MNKLTLLKFIDSQIKDLQQKIRNIDEDYSDYENIHTSIDMFGEMKRLKGAKETLVTMRSIIENGED